MNFNKAPESVSKDPEHKEALPQPPEGWKFFTEIENEVGCQGYALRKILDTILTVLPYPNTHRMQAKHKHRNADYYSPTVVELVRKHFQEFPTMPIDFRTAKQVVASLALPEHHHTIYKIIELLKEEGEISGKLFTDRNGDVVEAFPKEIVFSKVRERIANIKNKLKNNNV